MIDIFPQLCLGRYDTKQVERNIALLADLGIKPLSTGMHYFWKLRIWTAALDSPEKQCEWSRPAVFYIGLLDESDWKAD